MSSAARSVCTIEMRETRRDDWCVLNYNYSYSMSIAVGRFPLRMHLLGECGQSDMARPCSRVNRLNRNVRIFGNAEYKSEGAAAPTFYRSLSAFSFASLKMCYISTKAIVHFPFVKSYNLKLYHLTAAQKQNSHEDAYTHRIESGWYFKKCEHGGGLETRIAG